MLDFHSHILPGIDDGSHSVKESCELLCRLSQQGITRVIATPHFYANNESVDDFLARRRTAFEALKPHLSSDMPEILLGAEVRYYQGISRLEDLKKLCIENSNLLLLEMPFCKWTEYTVKEVMDMNSLGDIGVVLAHIERYMRFHNSEVLLSLLQRGVLMQVNASFFLDVFTRGKSLKMLENRSVQLIGSDCHNLTTRPPRIGEAFDRIRKKFGDGFVEYINDFANSLFY